MTVEFKVVVMKLGLEEYGIEVDKIKTIEKLQPITRIPRTPAFVRGVINLRGLVIPLLDLRRRFGMEPKEDDKDTRNIVVTYDGQDIGLTVDSANDVLNINPDDIQVPPEIVGKVRDKYVKGVVEISEGRLLILLNMEAVLDKKDLEYTQ